MAAIRIFSIVCVIGQSVTSNEPERKFDTHRRKLSNQKSNLIEGSQKMVMYVFVCMCACVNVRMHTCIMCKYMYVSVIFRCLDKADKYTTFTLSKHPFKCLNNGLDSCNFNNNTGPLLLQLGRNSQ